MTTDEQIHDYYTVTSGNLFYCMSYIMVNLKPRNDKYVSIQMLQRSVFFDVRKQKYD